MHRRLIPRVLVAAVCGLVAAGFAGAQSVPADQETALDKYVQKADPTYAWKIVGTYPGDKATTYVIHLKSQTWRSKADVDRPVWEHWLTIVQPKEVLYNGAFIFVAGGANGGEAPTKADKMTSDIAIAAKSVVAELKMIPNQPLIFHNDGVPRKEDDLIAYCWAQFLKTQDTSWLPRFPMVKSVVRAMDCVQEFTRGEHGTGKPAEKFVIAGGSKRGWTTWLTGVADKRVQAIVPIVIDLPNTQVSFRHHAAVYGFWAEAVGDYVKHGIMAAWDDPRLLELYKNCDPYYYRDRLTLPKYVVNASGDQFFLPDSSQFYYAELKGEKLLRYVPNADHSLKGTDALMSITAFYQMVLAGRPRPTLDWKFEADGSIVLTTNPKPKTVKLWQATNGTARDFRLETIGPAYKSQDIAANADGKFVGNITAPSNGWTAYFLEATFESGGSYPLKATTDVRVLPDRRPFEGIEPSKVPYEGRKPRRRG